MAACGSVAAQALPEPAKFSGRDGVHGADHRDTHRQARGEIGLEGQGRRQRQGLGNRHEVSTRPPMRRRHIGRSPPGDLPVEYTSKAGGKSGGEEALAAPGIPDGQWRVEVFCQPQPLCPTTRRTRRGWSTPGRPSPPLASMPWALDLAFHKDSVGVLARRPLRREQGGPPPIVPSIAWWSPATGTGRSPRPPGQPISPGPGSTSP